MAMKGNRGKPEKPKRFGFRVVYPAGKTGIAKLVLQLDAIVKIRGSRAWLMLWKRAEKEGINPRKLFDQDYLDSLPKQEKERITAWLKRELESFGGRQ